MSNTCTYFVVLNSPLIINRCACGSYEQARIKLASTLTAFARQGVEVLGHNDNTATLVAHTDSGDVPMTLNIVNNYWVR